MLLAEIGALRTLVTDVSGDGEASVKWRGLRHTDLGVVEVAEIAEISPHCACRRNPGQW